MRLDKFRAATHLASAMLAGPPARDGVIARIAAGTGTQGAWQGEITDLALAHYADDWDTTTSDTLGLLLVEAPGFSSAWWRGDASNFVRLQSREPVQAPLPLRLASIALPRLPTLGALADWLELQPNDLDWLADRWRSDGEAHRLHHYAYHAREKRDGRYRLIERPKSLLRSTQHKVLHGLLDRVPPHEAAHGFRKGRNIVSFASPHAGQPMVMSFDLQDFFISISEARVHALFRTLGYPAAVARAMTAIVTNRVPNVWLNSPLLKGKFDRDAQRRLGARHLPQGAATSPALANLCAFRLDKRLHALARSLGAQYTRYADDLAFSGGGALSSSTERLSIAVAAIALEEGFSVHLRKTRIMPCGVRQQLAGVVVNRHPNLARDRFDRIKATLHNCVLHGPASQNSANQADFRAHLMGCVAHVSMLNPARGAKLRGLFDRIEWPAVTSSSD